MNAVVMKIVKMVGEDAKEVAWVSISVIDLTYLERIYVRSLKIVTNLFDESLRVDVVRSPDIKTSRKEWLDPGWFFGASSHK